MILSAIDIEITTLIVSIFIALISAGTFWEFLKWLIEYRRSKIGVIKGIELLHDVYAIMQGILDTGAERVILFAGHNQGGIPRPTCGFWVSALHGMVSHDVNGSLTIGKKIPFDEYKNLKVDLAYISMLLDIQNNKFKLLKTAEMPDCNLKDYYTADQIKESLIVFLGIQEKKFIYFTAAKYTDSFNKDEITRILLKCEILGNIIEKCK